MQCYRPRSAQGETKFSEQDKGRTLGSFADLPKETFCDVRALQMDQNLCRPPNNTTTSSDRMLLSPIVDNRRAIFARRAAGISDPVESYSITINSDHQDFVVISVH
jgi:hypothetical protein